MVWKARTLALLVIVLSASIATAVFAIPYLTRPTERGATLTIALVNGTDSVHIVHITTRSAEDGTRVDFKIVAVRPGDTSTVALSLGREVNGVPLEVVFEDQTTLEASTRTWTPSAGASDTMDYRCPAG